MNESRTAMPASLQPRLDATALQRLAREVTVGEAPASTGYNRAYNRHNR